MTDKIYDPTTAVLLCIYQAKEFIQEQLSSIAAQDHKNISLWISDDGEDDGTLGLIENFRHYWFGQEVKVRQGPKKGFAANFLSQVCYKDIDADFFAFSDQDDIWEPDKLSRALCSLRAVPQDIPALYCSRTRLIDADGNEFGLSPLFVKKPSVSNALVQSISGGNTMVMNRAAREILAIASKGQNVVSHDWWAYIVISAVGGKIIYDPYPGVRYRQHGANIIGSNMGFFARMERIRLLLKGRFRLWNDLHITALKKIRHLMTPENQQKFDLFCVSRNKWILSRIYGIWKTGVYRQTFLGNLGLFVATILKRI